MDIEIVKKHWDLIKMVAVHEYMPPGMNNDFMEVANNYGLRKDELFCGFCKTQMCKRIYNEFKDRV